LFFSGGLGFLWFLTDFASQSIGFTDYLWRLPRDYTLNERFDWGNSLITLFITQRSLLLGMPLTIVVLDRLWEVFTGNGNDEIAKEKEIELLLPTFVAGLLAGLLPLTHLHSFAVLFICGLCFVILKRRKWKEWLAFAFGAALIGIPELVWSVSGTATKAGDFIGWNFGWTAKSENFLLFWFRNTGLALPLAVVGAYLIWRSHRSSKDDPASSPRFDDILSFSIPFAVCFVIANLLKLAPWEWDNIKVLIYAFVGMLPLIGFAIVAMWNGGALLRAASVACIMLLIFSGALDVWRTVSAQINNKVFDREAVRVAEQLKGSTEPRALFLNAPTYNSAVVLTGRRSLMRFPGHLWSHGIDYAQREADVKTMYTGGPDAQSLLDEYGIDYVVISPEERVNVSPNDAFFKRLPVAASVGKYVVYKVR
jgi:hypothetical protein